jgi:hypothetical protein
VMVAAHGLPFQGLRVIAVAAHSASKLLLRAGLP